MGHHAINAEEPDRANNRISMSTWSGFGCSPATRAIKSGHRSMTTGGELLNRLCHISGFYFLLLSSRREPGYAIPMPQPRLATIENGLYLLNVTMPSSGLAVPSARGRRWSRSCTAILPRAGCNKLHKAPHEIVGTANVAGLVFVRYPLHPPGRIAPIPRT